MKQSSQGLSFYQSRPGISSSYHTHGPSLHFISMANVCMCNLGESSYFRTAQWVCFDHDDTTPLLSSVLSDQIVPTVPTSSLKTIHVWNTIITKYHDKDRPTSELVFIAMKLKDYFIWANLVTMISPTVHASHTIQQSQSTLPALEEKNRTLKYHF